MSVPLFHQAYGTGLDRLPQAIRAVHDTRIERTWHGRVSVQHGTAPLVQALCRLMRLPPAATSQPLTVRMTAHAEGETWARDFDGWPMVSQLCAARSPDAITERFWPVAATSRLVPDAAGVRQTLAGLRVLGLPVPRALWPHLDVREGADGDRYTFLMRIAAPWGGLLIAYEGWLDTRSADN
jgi:hypothetical protein